MEDESWIKLYRKLLKSPIFDNAKALKVWIWCLLKATHVERKQLVGQQIVELKSGEFIFGRKKASEELKMTESTCYKYITLLENLEMISKKSNNKFTVITIEKWGDYQVYEDKKEQQSNSKVTTKEQQSNTNKNIKNVNNVKNIYSDFSEDIKKALDSFVEMRKKIKAPLTEQAMKLALNKLKEIAKDEETQIKVINESVMNSWKSFYPLKKENIEKSKKSGYNTYEQRQYDDNDLNNLIANR